MNTKNIEFIMNSKTTLIIKLKKTLDQNSCFCEIPIILKNNNKKYTLSIDNLYENMLAFRNCLKLSLKNKLFLDHSISDIGITNTEYMFSFIHNIPNKQLVYKHAEEFDEWVGTVHEIWSYQLLSTWLYNANNNIIFEVTPTYPHIHSQLPDNNKAYQKWIENYKPIISVNIPKKTAQEWFDKANDIIDLIETKSKNSPREIYEQCGLYD